jgi:MFS transporter, PPP family, 3-phenylpropionic acid transporter
LTTDDTVILTDVHTGQRRGAMWMRLLYALFYGSQSTWFTFINVYLQQLGFSGLQIGLLSGVRPAITLLSQPLVGLGADLWGRQRTLFLTMLLSSFFLLAFAIPGNFAFFLVLSVAYALASSPMGPLVDSLALDLVEKVPNLALGNLRLWGAAGWAVMAVVMGRLLSGQDLRLMFVCGTALMLPACLVGLRVGKSTAGGGAYRARALRKTWEGLGAVLMNRRLTGFLILVTLLQFGAVSMWTFLAIYMTQLGASRQLIGLAISVQGLSELPFYLAAAAIIRRLGPHKTLVFTLCMYALRAGLYSLVAQPVLLLLLQMMHGLTFSLFTVSAVEYVNRLVPSEWRATGQSLFGAAYWGAGAILGNLWAGFMYDRVGAQMTFRYSGLIILGVAAAAALILRDREKA